ncbi:MAG TPA: lipoprotein-releasing ABC transporter permease subunit [Magnetospirillum sp.]|nr:lipoprotein-releasing ABC transporter permease subunit [Magnetospirillum sp.]
MISAFERMVAFRYLRARRRETLISVTAGFSLVGIALGVAALIVVMSVMNGMRGELIARMIGVNGHLVIEGEGGRLVDYRQLADKVRQISGVVSVSPVVEGQVMASSGGQAMAALVRGMIPDDLVHRPVVGPSLSLQGIDGLANGELVVGAQLANRLGLGVGDPLTLISPKIDRSAGVPLVPRSRTLPVAGLSSVGMFEWDARLIYMGLEDAQAYFSTGDAVTRLDVMVDDVETIEQVRRAIEPLAGGAKVEDWRQVNKAIASALDVERDVTFVLLLLIVVVAAFNVIASLSMLVKEKGSDIAILRTMGASRGSILRIFLLAGGSVGMGGTLAGLVLGLGLATNVETIKSVLQRLAGGAMSPEIAFLANLPSQVQPLQVVGVVVLSLAIAFIATLPPSWRAANLDPIEALRYE